MSISAEYAREHQQEPAVLCCRTEAGTVIEAHNLEDPAIFDDLVDSNLLDLTGCLSIRQVLGARLTKTCDSLTALTRQVLEGVQELPEAEPAPAAEEEKTPAALPAAGGVLRIDIAEGKDIHIEIPLGGVSAAVSNTAAAVPAAPEQPPRLVRSLKRKHFKVTEVRRGPETRLEGTVLYIREGIEKDCVASQALVYDLKIDIITPDAYHTYSETIMDVQPIAAKEGESELGSGVTRRLQLLHGVETSVEHMSRMITELLDETHVSLTTAGDILREVMAQVSIAPYVHCIELKQPAEDLYVNANRIRFDRMLINLLENAYYALTDHKQGVIRLEADRVYLQGNGKILSPAEVKNAGTPYVRFLVSDNGRGMDEKTVASIFQRGFSTRGSSGLGLVFVKEVVETHGGLVQVDSHPQTGTTFTILIPEEESDE